MALHQAGAVVAQGFKAAYENIGILMLSNVVWFAAVAFPLFLVTLFRLEDPRSVFLAMVATVVLFGPATAGLHSVMYHTVTDRAASLAHFQSGFRQFFARSVMVTVVLGLVLALLIFNFSFSLYSPSTWIRLLSGIWIYFLVFWGIVVQLVFPFLVQQDIGVLLTLKRSALVATDNILVSFIVAVVNGIIVLLSLLLAAPILLFTMGLIALMQHYALSEILKKYENSQER